MASLRFDRRARARRSDVEPLPARTQRASQRMPQLDGSARLHDHEAPRMEKRRTFPQRAVEVPGPAEFESRGVVTGVGPREGRRESALAAVVHEVSERIDL